MFMTLTVFSALISVMFVASVISTVAELRRESEDFKLAIKRSETF
jgi:hypothetical protein